MNRVVLVTGGASGIGRSIVEGFLKAGDSVIMADIDRQKGEKAALKHERLTYCYTDFRSIESIFELFKTIDSRFDHLDVLVNNVGVTKTTPFLELDIKEWEEVIHVNLRSVFLTSQQAAKRMPYGSSIINLSSTRSLMSEPNTESYAASKGGVDSLTHAMAISLSNYGICVNAIRPGWIETNEYDGLRSDDHDQHPSKRVGKPEDISRLALFLSESDNDFINGEVITIDGGMTKKMIYRD